MFRTLILLTPLYISFFWIIAFRSNKKSQSTPANFLNIFMLISAICFFGQYLFFAPYPELFPYWEPLLAYFGSLAFPVYYIYFRLLTVDEKFTFTKHAKYLVVPILIPTIYTVGIFLTPFQQYKAWLYNENLFPDSSYIQFLGIMRKMVRLAFVLMLVVTYILNSGLLRKYTHKAEQYYSDYQHGEYNNAKILNYNLIFITVGCLIAHIVGRKLLLPKQTILDIIWLILSASLYSIGYMGFKQKSIAPNFDQEEELVLDSLEPELNLSQQVILNKLLAEFANNKIFLDSSLNITDVVQKVGSNRTYISSIINQNYGQNFCSFVNSYRLTELEIVFIENMGLSNEMLAEQCGFGSVNSMKRAIFSKTGFSIPEWKNNTKKNSPVNAYNSKLNM